LVWLLFLLLLPFTAKGRAWRPWRLMFEMLRGSYVAFLLIPDAASGWYYKNNALNGLDRRIAQKRVPHKSAVLYIGFPYGSEFAIVIDGITNAQVRQRYFFDYLCSCLCQ
jgi:hypothetical protein